MSDFRARSSAEILDAAFEIYRRHFAVFLAVGVVAALPMAVVEYSALAMSHGGARAAVPTDPISGAMGGLTPSTIIAMQGAMLLVYLVMLFVTPFTEATTITAAARAYRGEAVDLSDAIRAAFARPLAVLLTYWARGIIIGVVMLVAALVVGIAVAILAALLKLAALIVVFPLMLAVAALLALVWARYSVAMPALLVEHTRVGDALRRSERLTQGSLWRAVLLVIGTVVCAVIFSLVLGGIAGALASGIVGALLYLFAAALAGQFAGVVLTVFYFDLRIRKEGYDIELLAGSLTPAGSTAPTATPTPPSPAVA